MPGEDVIYNGLVKPSAESASFLTVAGVRLSTHGMQEWYKGLYGGAIASGVLALLSQMDYEHDKKLIRERYESEIGAQLGIRPELVTNKEMEAVAGNNPALKEDLRRVRWKRNLNIAVMTVCSFAGMAVAAGAVMAAAYFVPALIGGGLLAEAAHLAVSVGAGMLAVYFGEKVLKEVGEKQFNLKEPGMHEVEYNQSLQSKLSVPGQVHFLTRLQNRKTPITEDQIMTVLVSANPLLAEQIEQRYGAPFAELPPSVRSKVVEQIGPNFTLEELTEDLNTHRVRAQELSFIAYGQSSGVPKLETPQHTLLEKAHEQLQQKLAMAQAKIGELHERVNAQAASLAGKAKDVAQNTAGKLGFGKSQAGLGAVGTVAEAEPQQILAANDEPLGKFTAMHRPRVSANGTLAEQILADRQQQALQTTAVNA